MIDELANWTILAQATDAGKQGGASGFVLFLLVAAIFVVPFMLGALIAGALKLKDLGFRIGVVLFAVTLGIAPFAYAIVAGDSENTAFERAKEAIPLGIDLAGGTNLVYQVNKEEAEKSGKDVAGSMDRMVGAIARRINPSGTEEVTVRRVGSDRIEVIIPGADRQVVESKKRQMVRLGSLEFEILANGRDHRQIIREAEKLPPSVKEYRAGKDVLAIWRQVAKPEDFQSGHGEVALRTVPNNEGEDTLEVLTMVTPEKDRVTGKYLTRAGQTVDPNGTPAVSFNFNTQGAYLFQTLTSRNRPLSDGFQRRLAILLDGKVQSAPTLRETISSSGQISGDFSQQELSELVNVLNAGALEVPLERDPISENSISPLLGADVQEKGKIAIIAAALTVIVFMGVYYLVAGAIANFCLLVNVVLILGTMALIQATFTLPGLAGLVLTIGMAVDANVLIFERIREELHRGASLRMAIHNGFGRAFTTIVDANVTTLIVAVVLYMIGTDQVRGFAVTLFIGIAMSMFAALYVGRLVFDILERKRWLRSLKMLSFVGTTRLNFIGKRSIAAVGSFVLIVAGMTTLFARGEDNLDIDFRGGTMVTFEFVEPQTIDAVRSTLQSKFGTSITLERLTLTGEQQASSAGKRYRLRTTEQDVNSVRKELAEAFNDSDHELHRVTMTYAPPTQIPVPADDAVAENTEFVGFEGGQTTELTMSSKITEATVSDYLALAIDGLNKGYEESDTLFRVVGTEGPGTEADGGRVREYTTLRVDARQNLAPEDFEAALKQMQQTMASTPIFDEVNSFEKSVAGEMQTSAMLAMLFSLAAIIAYIWFRFQRITFGLAAVAALVHDVLVVLGMVALASYLSGTPIGAILALEDFKINLPMIAAFLTIVGYSLNDTIVVFDRIREVRGKNPALTDDIVNLSLNQTLSRTLLTSFTTLIVVGILYVFGGEGIHGFAFCLVIGIVVGTYSSIFVASPVLLWLTNRGQRPAVKAA